MSGMKDFSKTELGLRTLIESMIKSSRSYIVPIKEKSIFNTIGPLSQSVWIVDLGTSCQNEKKTTNCNCK